MLCQLTSYPKVWVHVRANHSLLPFLGAEDHRSGHTDTCKVELEEEEGER
jgi:hypothetical protein